MLRPVEESVIITVASVFFVPLTVVSFIPVLSVFVVYEGSTQVPSSLKNLVVPESVGVITPDVTDDSPLAAIGSYAVILTPAIVANVVAVVPITAALLDMFPACATIFDPIHIEPFL